MKEIEIPYGKRNLNYAFFQDDTFDLILPKENHVSKEQERDFLKKALNDCLGKDDNTLFNRASCTVAIAINDPTRPIPYTLLLPHLLKKLKNASISPKNISFFIATGTHKGLTNDELQDLLSPEIFSKYRTIVHSCDNKEQLTYLGKSKIGTPIYINSDYLSHDLKIVVGQIEPHHFMGFSGGVKSAVIGLGGRETIESNHQLILDNKAKTGIFYSNPMRKDIEEIGKTIGVDLALNVVLNYRKNIINAFYGDPYKVMVAGIQASNQACQVNFDATYDLVIASPGGYPKDINFYQSQKAITHACAFLKKKGIVVLVAECINGAGSAQFENYYQDKEKYQDVIMSFEKEVFRVGPHKAYQLALQLRDHQIILVSNMDDQKVKKMFLYPARNIEEAILISKNLISETPKIAVLPFATHTIPIIEDKD